MRIADAAVLLVVSFAPGVARADDWLASLPSCGLADRASVPSFELLYPRPLLPAVVAAGDTLIARARLPAPLTPPPGIQQPRALAGWRAELTGHAQWLAPAFGPDASQPERQALEVVNVRPDGAQSLIYRASIPIPAWVAPGSYDLLLSAPGGSGMAHSALRVLEPGHAPRLAWLGGEAPAASTAVSALPVDVWVRVPRAATDGPDALATTEPAAAPILDASGLVAALRIETGLWMLGSCRPLARAYEDEVRGVLAREGLTRTTPVPNVTPLAWQPFGAGPRSWPKADALRFELGQDRLRVEVQRGYPGRAELRLLVPADGRRTEIRGAMSSFYPAAAVTALGPSALVAMLSVAAGDTALVSRVPNGALRATLEARPMLASSGEPVRLRVLGIAPGTKVAWRLDPLRTAFGPAVIERSFGPLGEHTVVGLAIAQDGSVARLSTTIRVVTAQASGCQCSLHAPPAPEPTSVARWPRPAAWLASIVLVVLVVLVARRRSRKKRLLDGNRNRLRADLGFGQT